MCYTIIREIDIISIDLTNVESFFAETDAESEPLYNVIICGYGFTDEKDFIYQIDMNTGKTILKTEVEKMPDLLVKKYIPSHLHFNVTYLAEADEEQMLVINEEEKKL